LETDISDFQGNSNVIYKEVAQRIPKAEADPKYFLTKCPAYESHQLEPTGHGPKITGGYEGYEQFY